jgi:hypothetical protein
VCRIFEVICVVALWIGLGIGFHLRPNTYLLLGIPLTALFQCGVRRQPLRALWVRDAAPFRLGVLGWAMTLAFAAYPGYCLAKNLLVKDFGAETGWYLAAVIGAFGVAYALRNFHRASWHDLWFCLATAGVIGILILAQAAVINGIAHRSFVLRVSEFFSSLVLYVPVVFLLEEVSFRGAFDAHVHHLGESGEYATAFLVSGLWGLWHLPLVLGQRSFPMLALGLIGVHCAVGVPLSLYWRRSGNLFVPGATHALVDAIRNALFILG